MFVFFIYMFIESGLRSTHRSCIQKGEGGVHLEPRCQYFEKALSNRQRQYQGDI